ncbi:MAG: hypothetical protein ACREEM_45210 [Blastocatellia bacterium]
MDRYDPDRAPEASAWNDLDEGEQLRLVAEYHEALDVDLPNPGVHAVIHAVVENQLATPVPTVAAAMRRLRDEGLDRHEALHAIGSVLIVHLQQVTTSIAPSNDFMAAYERDLQDLTAASWHAAG